jgi:NAD(P)-dependent dehydrogenase (short-subunit alcohol dehydrogenase family)
LSATGSPDSNARAISPGLLRKRNATSVDVRANPQEFIDMLANAALLRRLAEPDEMVAPALLLTSDAGSFITGQVLVADDGLVAR